MPKQTKKFNIAKAEACETCKFYIIYKRNQNTINILCFQPKGNHMKVL